MKPVLHFRVFAVRHSQVGPRGEATSHCMSLPGNFGAGNVTRVIADKVPLAGKPLAYQRWLSRERHALRVVLEIYKTIAVVQLQLKQPEHCKSQKTRNLRPRVAAHGGEV